jgi:hypothetical protein
VRIKHHTLLFIIILGSLQGYHVLVASLTVYGYKNKCRINQKWEGWTSKIDVKEALIEHADYT